MTTIRKLSSATPTSNGHLVLVAPRRNAPKELTDAVSVEVHRVPASRYAPKALVTWLLAWLLEQCILLAENALCETLCFRVVKRVCYPVHLVNA